MSVTVTTPAHGNAKASASLAANTTVTFDIDLRTKYGGYLQIWNTGGGTVAATNGLRVTPYRLGDTTPNVDTEPFGSVFTIPTTQSAARRQSIYLQGGTQYRISLQNLDTANGITIEASLETIDTA